MKNTSAAYSTAAVFAAACIGICFFGVSMIVLGSVLPELSARFGLSAAQTTGLTTSLPAGILLGSLVFGPVVDRYGHKILLTGSCVAVLIGVATLAWAPDAAWLAAAIPLIGFGGGILNGETNALVTEIYTGPRQASRLSLLGMFYGLGALTIPVLLDRLSHTTTYTTVLAGFSAIMALCVVYCICVRFPAPKQPQGFPLGQLRSIATSPVLLLLSLILFFQSGLEGATNNWTTTYLLSTGLGESVGLDALSAMLIGLTAARLLQVWLFSRVAPQKVMLASLALAIAGYALLYTAAAPWVVFTAMAMIGAGLASTFPVIFGILGSRFPALSGTAFSIALVIALLGQMALNSATGLLAEASAIGSMPLLMIASLAAMILLFAAYRAVASKKSVSTL